MPALIAPVMCAAWILNLHIGTRTAKLIKGERAIAPTWTDWPDNSSLTGYFSFYDKHNAKQRNAYSEQ
jgi:hypothetical protein